MINDLYILDGHRPVRCDSCTWGKFMKKVDRIVKKTEVAKGIIVSTVFLGLDHRFVGRGPPILFETMTFGGSRDGQMYRYSSWDDAEAGHEAEVKRVVKALKVLENKG
jgi:hypothetical protein